MKKVLSLILAVVMVALMIPFSAFMASAAPAVTDSRIPYYVNFASATNITNEADINPNLPTGFVATTDDTAQYVVTSITDYGVFLGGADQALAMEEQYIEPAGAYTVEVNVNKYQDVSNSNDTSTGTSTGLASFDFGWGTTKPTYADGTASISFPSAYLRFDAETRNEHRALRYQDTVLYDMPTDTSDPLALSAAVLKESGITVTFTILNGIVQTYKIATTDGLTTFGEVDVASYNIDATGYLMMRVRNAGGRKCATVESISIRESSLEHYADFTKLPADDGSDGDVNSHALLGVGYVATTDSDSTKLTSVSAANGFTLGGADQALAMTHSIMDSSKNYDVEFTWNTTFKFMNLEWGWASTAPEAGNITFPSKFFRLTAAAGPNNDGSDEAKYDRTLSWGGKAWNDAEGHTVSDITYTNGYWDKVVASNDITVFMSVEAGVVTEVVISSGSTTIATFYPPAGTSAPAEGYLAIRITGWQINNSANIKNVKITNKSTQDSTSGGILQYTDFTKGFNHLGYTGDGSTTAYALADINGSLPAGYVVTKDQHFDSNNDIIKTATSISTANGVLLGGASGSGDGLDPTNQTLGATEAFMEATGNYVVEFTFNTIYKFANLEWGWSETAPTAATIGTDFPSEYLQLGVKAGPNNKNNTDATTLKALSATWLDAPGGSAVTDLTDSLKPLVRESKDIDVTMVVESGKVTRVKLSCEGSEIETFYAPEGKEVNAVGYFQIRITGWANSNSANIKKLVIKSTNSGDTETAGTLLHNSDMSTVSDIDALPYGIVKDTANAGYVELRDGAIWQGFNGMNALASNCTNGFRLDGDLYGNPDTFTLEFDVAGGSASRILFVSFSSTFSDGNSFKLRFGDAFSSDSMYVPAGEGFSTALLNDMRENGFTVRLIVVGKKLSRAIVSTASGSSMSLYPTRVISVSNKDLYFSQNSTVGFTGGYGISGIRITNAAAYTAELAPSGSEAILAPSNKAVIRANGKVSVISPASISLGNYLSGTKWIKESGTYTEAPTGDASTYAVSGGKIYALLNSDSAKNLYLIANGTDLRLASNPGIRFRTEVALPQVNDILKLATDSAVQDVYYGTLITTYEHAHSAGGIVTLEALQALGERSGKKVYIDLDTEGFYDGTENIFAGSVVEITDQNRAYLAVGYANITLADGTQHRIYSNITTVSLADLAREIAAGGYVGYSDNEKKALQFVLDRTIPEYTGGGTLTSHNNFELSESRYDLIDGATETDFKNYTALLAAEGYTCYQSNPVNGQLFEIWTDTYNIITVAHIAYTDPAITDKYMDPGPSLGAISYMSIAYDTIENSALPEMTLESKTDVAVEQLTTTPTGSQQGYLIRMSDGRFIVVDGGFKDAAAEIYNLLEEQNVLEGKPVIAAWFLTHAHNDHYEALNAFVKAYSDKVIIESFVSNLPDYWRYYGKNVAEKTASDETAHNTTANNLRKYCTNYYKSIKTYYPNADIIVAHAGQKFVFGTMTVDVLYTSENIYKREILDTNMTSVVYSIEGRGGRMIILGDQVDIGSPQVAAIYGSTLKADLVQVAHHGYNNGHTSLYNNIDAKYAIWTNTVETVTSGNLQNGSRNNFDYTSVVSNIIPSESNLHITITENTTQAQMKALDAI